MLIGSYNKIVFCSGSYSFVNRALWWVGVAGNDVTLDRILGIFCASRLPRYMSILYLLSSFHLMQSVMHALRKYCYSE